MGRITPSLRQLYDEVMSDLRTELQGAFVDLGHKNAFVQTTQIIQIISLTWTVR